MIVDRSLGHLNRSIIQSFDLSDHEVRACDVLVVDLEDLRHGHLRILTDRPSSFARGEQLGIRFESVLELRDHEDLLGIEERSC